MLDHGNLGERCQKIIDDREFKTSTGNLFDVDSIKNQIERGYVEQEDHYHLQEKLIEQEIDKAIESAKNFLVPEIIESALERPMTLDSIREKIEIRDLLDQYNHPTKAIRLQIEKDPSVR